MATPPPPRSSPPLYHACVSPSSPIAPYLSKYECAAMGKVSTRKSVLYHFAPEDVDPAHHLSLFISIPHVRPTLARITIALALLTTPPPPPASSALVELERISSSNRRVFSRAKVPGCRYSARLPSLPSELPLLRTIVCPPIAKRSRPALLIHVIFSTQICRLSRNGGFSNEEVLGETGAGDVGGIAGESRRLSLTIIVYAEGSRADKRKKGCRVAEVG